MKRYVRAACVLGAIVLLGAGCLAPGSRQTGILYLPDHIEQPDGETLPRALKEARERGKVSVRVTNPDGTMVTADIRQATSTRYTFDVPEGVDAYEMLVSSNVDLSHVYQIVEGEGVYAFTINEVAPIEQASMMYEIAVRVQNLQDTSSWVIDVE